MSRTATLDRQTSESKVHVEVDLDGSGRHDVSTGVGGASCSVLGAGPGLCRREVRGWCSMEALR